MTRFVKNTLQRSLAYTALWCPALALAAGPSALAVTLTALLTILALAALSTHHPSRVTAALAAPPASAVVIAAAARWGWHFTTPPAALDFLDLILAVVGLMVTLVALARLLSSEHRPTALRAADAIRAIGGAVAAATLLLLGPSGAARHAFEALLLCCLAMTIWAVATVQHARRRPSASTVARRAAIPASAAAVMATTLGLFNAPLPIGIRIMAAAVPILAASAGRLAGLLGLDRNHQPPLTPSTRLRFTAAGWTVVWISLGAIVLGRLLGNPWSIAVGCLAMAWVLLSAHHLQVVLRTMTITHATVPMTAAATVRTATLRGHHPALRFPVTWNTTSAIDASPGATGTRAWRATQTLPPAPRGWHPLPPIVLRAADAWGWAQATRALSVPGGGWVYPAPHRLITADPHPGEEGSDQTLLHRHRPEEGAAKIAWRPTARSRETWARGRQEETARTVWADENAVRSHPCEARWAHLAAVILEADPIAPVGMRWCDGRIWPPQSGRAHREDLLRALAGASA